MNLTNNSLHLRKLARFFLYTHGCGGMLMCSRADVDNELILFGGALQIRLPRFQLLEKVGGSNNRYCASNSGSRNSNSEIHRAGTSLTGKGSKI